MVVGSAILVIYHLVRLCRLRFEKNYHQIRVSLDRKVGPGRGTTITWKFAIFRSLTPKYSDHNNVWFTAFPYLYWNSREIRLCLFFYVM